MYFPGKSDTDTKWEVIMERNELKFHADTRMENSPSVKLKRGYKTKVDYWV